MTRRSPVPQLLVTAGLAGVFTVGLAGCHRNQAQSAPIVGDPAMANMAQPYTGGNAGGYGDGQTQVLAQSQSAAQQAYRESFETQAPAPIIRRAPTSIPAATPTPIPAANQTTPSPTVYYPVPQAKSTPAQYTGAPQTIPNESQAYQSYPAAVGDSQNAGSGPYDPTEQAGDDALAEADQPPPPLPEYDQPPAPQDDYQWTPGYWNYASAGYFWVPGIWVAPPFYGALWTPPYWGNSGGRWLCHRGYWGRHVGYYGGIDYGFGYIGTGYFGGYWSGQHFFYNRAVSNVNITQIHNVYNHTVIYNNTTYGPRSSNRTSFNGGRGGINAQPRPQELAAMRETRFAPTAGQREHRQQAADNRGQFFRDNHDRPAQAFSTRPLGNPANIAAAPQTPGFVRNQQINRPGLNGRPQPTLAAPGQDGSAAGLRNAGTFVQRPATLTPQSDYGTTRPNGYGITRPNGYGQTGTQANGAMRPGNDRTRNNGAFVPGGDRNPATLANEHRNSPQRPEGNVPATAAPTNPAFAQPGNMHRNAPPEALQQSPRSTEQNRGFGQGRFTRPDQNTGQQRPPSPQPTESNRPTPPQDFHRISPAEAPRATAPGRPVAPEESQRPQSIGRFGSETRMSAPEVPRMQVPATNQNGGFTRSREMPSRPAPQLPTQPQAQPRMQPEMQPRPQMNMPRSMPAPQRPAPPMRSPQAQTPRPGGGDHAQHSEDRGH